METGGTHPPGGAAARSGLFEGRENRLRVLRAGKGGAQGQGPGQRRLRFRLASRLVVREAEVVQHLWIVSEFRRALAEERERAGVRRLLVEDPSEGVRDVRL